jgi:DHA2 family methylenomycin A resistance protein-like MFS transporter
VTPKNALVLAAICLGQFLIQLDLTVVNVALPQIGRDLDTSVSGLQWVVDGYNLALAGLLLVGGRLGDRSGHRRVYLVGLTVFALGSGLCALADSTGALVCFRVLQGVGAAIELPATLAILTHTFVEQKERAQAVGVWTAAAGTALVVGPVLGGALVSVFGWQAVFLVNLPIVLLVGVLVCTSVRDIAKGGGPLDLRGQVLGTTGLALLAAGAIESGRPYVPASLTAGLLAAGVLSLAAFVAAERRSRHPMLPLGYFRRASYSAANADAVVMGFVTIGSLFVFSLYFQRVYGDSPLEAGLRFLPLTVAFVLVGPVAGRAIATIGHRTLMTSGCALMGVGNLLLLLRTGVHTDPGATSWPFTVVGLGYGLLSTPMAAAVLDAVPAGRAGMASSTNLTGRLVGGVFGIAVLGALLPSGSAAGTAQAAFASAFVDAVHAACLVVAAVAFAGAATAAAFIGGPVRDRTLSNV